MATIPALFTELRQAGVEFSLHPNGTLRSRAPKGALSAAQITALKTNQAALLTVFRTTLLRTPPANHVEPCPHPRVFTRADGAQLCVQCWHVLTPGSTLWTPEPAPERCVDGQHEPYPVHPSMPGIRQCQHCPEVWRAEPAPLDNTQEELMQWHRD